MQIITLTTDMGLKDHYVASLKGTIFSALPAVQIVDITHYVKPFNVGEAAYHLNSCYKNFPDGTIHVIGVDSEPVINFGTDGGSFPAILKYNNQYFISNDNGFFGVFLVEKAGFEFFRIDNVLSNQNLYIFPTKNILVKTALELAKGTKIEDLASEHENYKRALHSVAISETNLIKGHIIHIDDYGNLITNVSRELFERSGKDVPFVIYFKSKEYFVDIISNSFNEVPEGEKLAMFNENGLLMIAINRAANRATGGAEKLFGLHINDIVRIEFTPQGSRETLDSLF
jgi:S-adenosylmethionine hydrolase